jgi:hypothetical protein
MKTTISKISLLLILFILTLSVGLLVATPKAVLLDKSLNRVGINLLAQKVNEQLFAVSLEEVEVFYRNLRLAELDRLSFELTLTGLRLSGFCGNGSVLSRLGWSGVLEIHMKRFKCSELFQEAEGKIELKKDIWGNLHLRGLKLRGFEIEEVKLSFKGKSFEGSLTYGGMTFTGGGSLELSRENIRSSRINATFRGELGQIVLRGSLSNISAELR